MNTFITITNHRTNNHSLSYKIDVPIGTTHIVQTMAINFAGERLFDNVAMARDAAEAIGQVLSASEFSGKELEYYGPNRSCWFRLWFIKRG